MSLRAFGMTIVICVWAGAFGAPAAGAAASPRDGAYAFGCQRAGVGCVGTFRVDKAIIRDLRFRPLRCVDGEVAASTQVAVQDGRFDQSSSMATSSIAVPVDFAISGSFRTATRGAVQLSYGAPAVGCASVTARYAFATRSRARLGAQGWRDAGLAIDGAVDADAVVLPDGRLRMYYGLGVGGSATWRITSSVTSDGRNWQSEATNLVGRSWGPADIVRLPDGRFRMYYTPSDDAGLPAGQQRSVRSAISDDGITWTIEDGFRLDPAAYPQLVPTGGIQYGVSHPGVVQLADGTWLMLAAFSYERGFDPRGFSSATKTELIVWATSIDGLAFTARGIAVDSRHKATFDGYASSPDPVIWEDGTVRAYFWSPGPQIPHDQERYNGILFTTFTGTGWTKPKPVRTSAPFPGAFAAGDGGSDPTSAIFGGRMLLFHGHGDGKHEVLQRSVITTDTHRLRVVRTGGAGTIKSGMALGASSPRGDASTGLACRGSRCSTTVFDGTKMWLVARPRSGYRFAGWKGCNVRRPSDFPAPLPGIRLCWVRVTKDVKVTARFVRSGGRSRNFVNIT